MFLVDSRVFCGFPLGLFPDIGYDLKKMMKRFAILAVGVVISSAAAHADLTIVQKVEGLGEGMETTVRYKDGQTRLDVSPGGFSIIVDTKTGETITLQHAQKRFLKAPNTVVQAAVDSVKQQQESNDGKAAGIPQSDIAPTGHKETISSYPAEEYRYIAADARFSLWLTRDIPDYEQAMKELSAVYLQGPLAAMTQTAGLDMNRLPGFPVRIVNENRPDAPVTSTVISVSLKPIDEETFKVPADYTEIKTPVLTPPAATSQPEPVHSGH